MSAPFKFGASASSGPAASSLDTTSTSHSNRNASSGLARWSAPRKVKIPGTQRAPGQPYVHFHPSTSPGHGGNPVEDSSEPSHGDYSGSTALPYDEQPPQPRSPVGSVPSGPSGRSGLSGTPGNTAPQRLSDVREHRSARDMAQEAPAGEGGPFMGTAGDAPPTAPPAAERPADAGGPALGLERVSRTRVEGGVVAEARPQRPRYNAAYGAILPLPRSPAAHAPRG